MSEPLTSNPHAGWLRRVAAEAYQAVEYSWSNTCEEAADEIERLTAERNVAVEDALRAERIAKLHEAERDRLAAENEARLTRNRAIQDHNDRLRAALERIQTIYQLTHVHECARVVLAGGADYDPLASKDHGIARAADETSVPPHAHGGDPKLCKICFPENGREAP